LLSTTKTVCLRVFTFPSSTLMIDWFGIHLPPQLIMALTE
jgi:hypothetical protein